jgi:hypothetical protein
MASAEPSRRVEKVVGYPPLGHVRAVFAGHSSPATRDATKLTISRNFSSGPCRNRTYNLETPPSKPAPSALRPGSTTCSPRSFPTRSPPGSPYDVQKTECGDPATKVYRPCGAANLRVAGVPRVARIPRLAPDQSCARPSRRSDGARGVRGIVGPVVPMTSPLIQWGVMSAPRAAQRNVHTSNLAGQAIGALSGADHREMTTTLVESIRRCPSASAEEGARA